jgi:hypothetical protein
MTLLATGELKVTQIAQAEAHLIPPLLYRVFGYTYTDESLYLLEGVIAAISGERNLFFAVIDVDADEARGLVAMRFCYPSSAVAELGMLLVDPVMSPAASGKVLRKLGDIVDRKSRSLAHERGLLGLISTEVTVHTLTQRLVEQFGFITTGIYLGWTPAWAERLRIEPSGRIQLPPIRNFSGVNLRRTETVSTLPFGKVLKPYVVALPRSFGRILSDLYIALKLPASPTTGVPAKGSSVIVEDLNIRRSRVVLELTTIGADAAELLLTRLAHYRSGLVDLVHFALPLTEVDIDPVVEALVASGARYGALIPLYRGHDVLMLQYVNSAIATLTARNFHSPLAKRLFQEIV